MTIRYIFIGIIWAEYQIWKENYCNPFIAKSCKNLCFALFLMISFFSVGNALVIAGGVVCSI